LSASEAAGAVKHNVVITIWHQAKPSYVVSLPKNYR
jgi:hypothetical protein